MGGIKLLQCRYSLFLLKSSLFPMRLTMTLLYFVNIFVSSWKVVVSVTAKNSINLHWSFSFKGAITTRVNDWYLPALINPMSNVILTKKHCLSNVWISLHTGIPLNLKSKVKCGIIYFDLVWSGFFLCYIQFPNNSEIWILDIIICFVQSYNT